MTNEEKFKSAKDRYDEFDKFCNNHLCDNCPARAASEELECLLTWLELEDEEELKPCPFCGAEARIVDLDDDQYMYYQVCCTKCKCKMDAHIGKHNAIAAWNRRTK